MAYPTVKAGTTHVDAGSDSPKQARADIKQNIDNVNALIDHFNSSGPISIQGNEITSTRSNDDLILQASGTGKVSSPETINFNTVGRMIITDQAAGTFSSEALSSIGMLYNNGIQVEAAGAWEYPALVLKTYSENGYPTLWAARSNDNNWDTDEYLQNNDTLFRFFASAWDGATYTRNHASIDIKASQQHTSTNQGAKIVFQTATDNTKVAATRLTIDDHIEADTKVEFNKNYQENITALTSALTIDVDCTLSSFFSCTLEHTDARFVITDLPTGGSVTLIITQDSGGNNGATFESSDSSAVKFSVGTPTLSTGSGDIDVVTIFNDGVNFLGSIAKNFRTGT